MLRQPGGPFDVPTKKNSGVEQFFAPPLKICGPSPPFAACAASNETEDAKSDRAGSEQQTPIRPTPTTATELWTRPQLFSIFRSHKSPPPVTFIPKSSASTVTSSGLHINRSAPLSAVRSSGAILFSPPSTPRAFFRGDVRHLPSSTTLSSLVASTTVNMMVNIVPSVVLHFHGFRSSLLGSIGDAACRIAFDMAQRSLAFTAAAVAAYVMKMLVEAALRKLTVGLVVYTAFLACESLARKYDPKRCPHLLISSKHMPSLHPPTLPRLQLPASIAMLPQAPTFDIATEMKQIEGDATQCTPTPSILATPPPMRQLSAVRRRLAMQMRAPFPGVNAVPRERRRRTDVALHDAKIRVGKAFVEPTVNAVAGSSNAKPPKPVDTYMVRVDCSTADDKHMNPVVMWDFTATFEEFRKLEKDLRIEIKAKRLRNLVVPHLSSGAILFVQPELTQDVLAKRRLRLQAFVDALRTDRVLADGDAMRKFCQAV